MTRDRGEPILRVVPGPGDINANGHIFGGWVLSQMDIAAGIVASREAQGPVATVAIEAMEFIAPILLRDLVSVYAKVERIGRTSIAIRIDVIASRDRGTARSRSPKACSPSSRSTRSTSRGRSSAASGGGSAASCPSEAAPIEFDFAGGRDPSGDGSHPGAQGRISP